MKKKDKDKEVLTRAGIANAIVEEFEITKLQASDIVEDILEEIALALVAGESVKISGFGHFFVREKKERIGRNPKTMQEAVIEFRKTLIFKASPVLKKIVNGDYS
ncbi:MAG: integration host factor subunit alpha [Holosporaceae bacterium]|jgi:integration host factor subunit alpha|nr:integration host factor subunit alpha [Holosporaceae bacterium]